MTKTEAGQLKFTSIKSCQVRADFNGGQLSSDGGLLLVREVDRKLGLVDAIADRLSDPRECGKVVHETRTMLRQRVMAMIAGWQDLNDAAVLRTDGVHQVAAGTGEALASAPTLCRFENRQDRAAAWAVRAWWNSSLPRTRRPRRS